MPCGMADLTTLRDGSGSSRIAHLGGTCSSRQTSTSMEKRLVRGCVSLLAMTATPHRLCEQSPWLPSIHPATAPANSFWKWPALTPQNLLSVLSHQRPQFCAKSGLFHLLASPPQPWGVGQELLCVALVLYGSLHWCVLTPHPQDCLCRQDPCPLQVSPPLVFQVCAKVTFQGRPSLASLLNIAHSTLGLLPVLLPCFLYHHLTCIVFYLFAVSTHRMYTL